MTHKSIIRSHFDQMWRIFLQPCHHPQFLKETRPQTPPCGKAWSCLFLHNAFPFYQLKCCIAQSDSPTPLVVTRQGQDPLACNILPEPKGQPPPPLSSSSPEAEVFYQSCSALFEEVAARTGKVVPICPMLRSQSLKLATNSILLSSLVLLANGRFFHLPL